LRIALDETFGTSPQLSELVAQIPTSDYWAHEIKFDDFRMHARIVGGAVTLLTRNGLNWTAKYPEIARALGALECRNAYLDGELCAVQPGGTTSFSALQAAGAVARSRLFRVRPTPRRRWNLDAAAAAGPQGSPRSAP
jgi:ATP-dependent DNA ligase